MDLFLRILAIITPVLLIVLIGYVYARYRRPDLEAMNTLNIDLLAPLLIFSGLTAKNFDLLANRWLLLGGFCVIWGSGLVALIVARWRKWDTRTFLPPVMFGNTVNMGVPLAVLALGSEAFSPAIALFIMTFLIQFTIGAWLVDRGVAWVEMLRNPMIIAALLGIAFNLGGVVLPDWLAMPLRLLGDAAIPLMLFALGARMLDLNLSGWRIGLVGAALRPLSGLLVAAIFIMLVPLSHADKAQLLIYGSLPPAVINFIVAERYRQEPEKVASIVLLGNIASLVFVPIGLAFALTDVLS
jgi:malate permease and related proteins